MNTFPTPTTPVIAKLNPDGTLDQSFQQGIIQGTLIELPGGFNSDLLIEIDPSGRIILFGNNPADSSGVQNFAVSRLNPDGTIDTSFANDGNQFILGSSFTDTGSVSEVLGLDVLDNGDITLAFTLQDFFDPTFVVSRLLADGSVDRGFGDNGFFVRSFESALRTDLFQPTPGGGSAYVFSVRGSDVDTLLLLNPDGVVTAETDLTLNSEILFGSLSPFSGAFTLPGDLAVDQAGNIVFTSLRRIPGPFGPFNAQSSVVQRILPSG